MVSWAHIVTASLSLVVGAIVLFSRKGTAMHLKNGIIYFRLMLVSNVTALCIYSTGSFFFAH